MFFLFYNLRVSYLISYLVIIVLYSMAVPEEKKIKNNTWFASNGASINPKTDITVKAVQKPNVSVFIRVLIF